jgi:hypothetical protein
VMDVNYEYSKDLLHVWHFFHEEVHQDKLINWDQPAPDS